MANTFWQTANDDGISDLGPHEWRHNEKADSADFDKDFYQLQPRMGIYAMSAWDSEFSHTGAYNSLGTPDVVCQLKPVIGSAIGFIFEMFSENGGGTSRIKFYLVNGANRQLLTLVDETGAFIGEVTTTLTRSGWVSVRANGLQTVATSTLFFAPPVGDLVGEDCELEMYLENTTSSAVVLNMRVYSGESLNVNTATSRGDYLI